jgi:hypothetical protein
MRYNALILAGIFLKKKANSWANLAIQALIIANSWD